MTTGAKDWGITKTQARKVLDVIDAGLVKGVGTPKPGSMCVEAAVCYALGLPHGDDPECVSRAVRSLKIALNDKAWSSNAARAKGLRRLGLAQLGSRDHIDDREFAKRVAELAIRTCVPQALRAAASIHKDPVHQQAMRAMADKCEREPTEANSREARRAAVDAVDAAYAAAYAAYAAAYAAYADAAADAAAYAAYADAADGAADAAAYAAYADAAVDAADAAADAAAYAAYADAVDAVDAAYAAADAAAYAAAYAAKKSARDKSLADFAEGVVQILIEMKAPGTQWLALTEAA